MKQGHFMTHKWKGVQIMFINTYLIIITINYDQ